MAEYIERKAVCYQLAKQATIDGQPRAIRRAAKIVADFPAADVVPVRHGKWVLDGVQMIINLENARKQYKELGYPHRNELRMRCSNCKKITMVDASIRYEYCPHCGARMDLKGDADV